MKLISILQDTKTKKSLNKGYLTGIVYLAPGNISGFETCKSRSKGCFTSCLFTSGYAGIYPKINQTRINRTRLFFEQQDQFFTQLCKEIEALERKANKMSLIPCIRLNGTSDIKWENYPLENHSCIMDKYPHIQFYDYTKHDIIKRYQTINSLGIKNYDLTYSRNETKTSHKRSLQALQLGYRVATVFKKELPKTYMSYKVINADNHDLRFINPKGCVCGLSAKGKARKDKSGFVL